MNKLQCWFVAFFSEMEEKVNIELFNYSNEENIRKWNFLEQMFGMIEIMKLQIENL